MPPAAEEPPPNRLGPPTPTPPESTPSLASLALAFLAAGSRSLRTSPSPCVVQKVTLSSLRLIPARWFLRSRSSIDTAETSRTAAPCFLRRYPSTLPSAPGLVTT